MSLTEEIIQDKVEVVGTHKFVQVRTVTIIRKDGKEISRSFHRHAVEPNSDISNESVEVQAVCNAVHTDAVKANYNTFLESLPKEST